MIPFDEVRPEDRDRIGAKAFTLAQLRQAGFNVPDGFIVPSDSPLSLDRVAIVEQLARLKGDHFAVRSSASNEDDSRSSMAGQYRTHLGISGIDSVLEAITDCRNYYPQHIAKPAGIAVIVQELVSADVAGVMFTANPLDLSDNTLSIEASWGIGDSVVSGRVTPDRYTLKETIQREPTDERRCLENDQIQNLANLGRRIVEHLGSPQDIEWAIANDKVWLLQSRPITVGPNESVTIRQEIIEQLRAIAGNEATVWVTDAISESVLHPTPMTWSIMQRLLAADGGAGAMSRTIGVGPDPQLGSRSAYDLIAGRPKLNLRRAAQMRFGRLPLTYPIEKYLADPAIIDAQQEREIALKSWLHLPWIVCMLICASVRQRRIRRCFADKFQQDILPWFHEECRHATLIKLDTLSNTELLKFLHSWIHRTCVEYGEKSQLLTHFLDYECQQLQDTGSAIIEVLEGAEIPAEVDLGQAMQSLRAGAMTRDVFLAKFGHRGFNEMELAQPRWQEQPEQLTYQHAGTSWKRKRRIEQSPSHMLSARSTLAQIHKLVELRELAKDAFMRGVAIVRACLLELDRRWDLDGNIFELELGELALLKLGRASELIQRRTRRRAEAMLFIPDTILSNDLEAIGRHENMLQSATRLYGTGISNGSATGYALVLQKPEGVPPLGPYILVCPTSDPAWTPWFMNACGIIMERGGMLSHGAILARELGIPAIAGVANATLQIQTGQQLHLDAKVCEVRTIEEK